MSIEFDSDDDYEGYSLDERVQEAVSRVLPEGTAFVVVYDALPLNDLDGEDEVIYPVVAARYQRPYVSRGLLEEGVDGLRGCIAD